MNKQIIELAEQAGRESFDSELTSLLQVSTEHKMYEVPAGFIEKFAELIVRECMTMSDELKDQYLASRKSTTDFGEKNIYAEGESACDILKHKMKRRFGVKR